jgi:type II secretory pathway pseudopilin PulG
MKIRRRPGQTLMEVTMATMIAAITTTAVFSVILSSFVSGAKADKRDAAAMSLRYAQEMLKSYVSVDPTDANYVPSSASGIGRWPADTSGWPLRGALCLPNASATSGTLHTISTLVANPNPLSPTGLPAASLTYRVCSYDCGLGTGAAPNYASACKRVTLFLTYTDTN